MGMRVTVYNKDRIFQRQVGAPVELVVTPRAYPLIGSADMTVRLDDPAFDALMDEGARVVIERDGEFLLSGPVDATRVGTADEYLKVTVLDDSYLLGRILGWQVPTASIFSQGSREYGIYVGNAESVVKAVVRENGINRLKIPGLTIAADRNRGTNLPGGASFRMHSLPDRLFPALELAGLGVRIRQEGANLVFDVYEPRVYGTVLSVEARTIKDAVHTRRRPQASRVVTGGSGEGVLRRYRMLIDQAREALWGFCGETFRDARDVKDDAESGGITQANATMDARGAETLAETAAVDGLSITLAESSIFTYGSKGVLVGDRVPVNVRGRIITDTVREARIEWVTPEYSRAEPILGEIEDPDRRQAKTLAGLQAAQRKEERY